MLFVLPEVIWCPGAVADRFRLSQKWIIFYMLYLLDVYLQALIILRVVLRPLVSASSFLTLQPLGLLRPEEPMVPFHIFFTAVVDYISHRPAALPLILQILYCHSLHIIWFFSINHTVLNIAVNWYSVKRKKRAIWSGRNAAHWYNRSLSFGPES